MIALFRSITRGVLVLGVVSLLATAASAGAVAPRHISDIRTLATDSLNGTVCTAGGGGFIIDQQVNPDGTSSPFSIPAGSVFIVTSWEWSITEVAPSEVAQVQLVISPGTLPKNNLSFGSAQADSNGFAQGNTQTPEGIVVASGASLCIRWNAPWQFGQLVRVHGFLAKE